MKLSHFSTWQCLLQLIIAFIWPSFFLSFQFQSIPFYGDTSLPSYLVNFCASYTSTRTTILLVEYSHNSTTTTGRLSSLLRQLHCPFDHTFGDSFIAFFNQTVMHSHAYKYTNLQIILDASMVSKEIHLDVILQNASTIYSICSQCTPVIVYLNYPSAQIHQMLSQTFSLSDNNTFQAVLVSSQSSQSFHIRPVVNGCNLVDETIFVPKTAADFAMLKVPPSRCNLHRKMLNIALVNDSLYCSFRATPNGAIAFHYSVEYEMLQIMIAAYNFSTNYLDGGTWGIKVNGSWIGSVGLVSRGEAHFGMCSYIHSEERKEVVDFTWPTFLDDLVFMSQRPGSGKALKKDLVFDNQISTIIWACNLMAFVLCFAVLKANRLVEIHSQRNNSVVLQIYGILMRQTMPFFNDESTHSARLLLATWLLGSFLLANFYSSHFYSLLTLRQPVRPLDTVDQLLHVARTDSHYIITQEKSGTLTRILNSTPDSIVYFTIKQHMARTKRPMLNSVYEVTTLEADSRLVYITLRFRAQLRRDLFARKALHISSEAIGQVDLSWIVPKRSPLRVPFDRIILRIQEVGLRIKWLQNMVKLHKSRVADGHYINGGDHRLSGIREHTRVLTLNELCSVFLILTFGLGTSWGCFMLEIAVKLWFRK